MPTAPLGLARSNDWKRMSLPFPIIPVHLADIRDEEPMGSKDKHWCELVVDGETGAWLLKLPRQEPGKGEHWAEKLAAEYFALVDLPCARVELAEYQGVRATVCRKMDHQGEALVHGNEVIAGLVTDYDREKKRRSTDHTYERIRAAIEKTCVDRSCAEDLKNIAGYLVLDALIGNTDRHHENWALLRKDVEGKAQHRLAPSFDHASSLGREMRDDRRARLLRENAVEKYLREGKGAIFLESLPQQALSPFALVEDLAPLHPDEFHPWLARIAALKEEELSAPFERMPDGWMSEPQKQLARAMLLQSQLLLSKLIPNS